MVLSWVPASHAIHLEIVNMMTFLLGCHQVRNLALIHNFHCYFHRLSPHLNFLINYVKQTPNGPQHAHTFGSFER